MTIVREVTLSTLAIDALEDYVCTLFLKFVNEDDMKFKTVCKNLKEILVASVPLSLVNEVTYRLLRGLDNTVYTKVRCAVEIVEQFVNAVVHPCVTELNFGPDFLHESLRGFDWNYIVLFVYRELENLERLKLFRMSTNVDGLEFGRIRFPSGLEEFTFMYCCNDYVLETIAHMCENLKRLNVSKSRNISDASVSSILKFKHLEELNIEGTDITDKGVTKLLEGLIENKLSGYGYSWSCASQLLSFGCSNATTRHIHILVTSFPNLVCVILSCDRTCSLLELKEMVNLRVLWLSYIKFPQIESLLVSHGSQLQYLDICDVGPVNVRAIGEACYSLKCLHIMSSDTSSIPPAEDFHSPLAGFQSVECAVLQLDFNPEMVEYILCQCHNLRRLEVTVEIGNDSAVISNVLGHNTFQYLEEFSWWGSSGTLSRDTAIQVVQRCPQLQVLRGPFVWVRHGDFRDLHRHAKKNVWSVKSTVLHLL